MKFSEIPGQTGAKETLRHLADTSHVPHALMISGPSGSGKMLLARAFAQYLHCDNPHDGEPCGVCTNCRLHADNGHPDLRYVFPWVKSRKLDRETLTELWDNMLKESPSMPEERWLQLLEAGNSQPAIYVEDAEDIVQADAYPSTTSHFKITIIWLPEKMNPTCANKILKVVEEPSDGTVFIFVSNNELEVLPTIFSRVQRINVGRLSDSEISEYLTTHYHLVPDQANQYSRLCNGSLIRADELGGNTGENEEFLAMYQDVMRAAYAKKVNSLKRLSESVAAYGREKNKRFLNYMGRMIRENFLFNLHMPQLNAMTSHEEQFSVRFSPFINHHNVEDFLAETTRARRDIERNANAKVVIFDYFLYIIILLHRKTQ